MLTSELVDTSKREGEGAGEGGREGEGDRERNDNFFLTLPILNIEIFKSKHLRCCLLLGEPESFKNDRASIEEPLC